MPRLTFNKSEKLKSRKRISLLFSEGQIVKSYPIKLLYNLTEREEEIAPVQVGVTVPIRNFRKAVKRNRIKRVVREAYRINKMEIQSLKFDPKWHLDIMIIYVGREMSDYDTISKAIIKGLGRLRETLKSELDN